ncbi:hypothetical protein [Actinoplanes xinjiangensis]|uniref:Uncharacterized protein n=1 Tax=Actinoplanes xinjiangensis TaxID=512350 RepID=A0A316FVX4_9ACTN|nr:hypothetical protein [Actinoplanes xinjiangensis]PWK52235.1 hypothetical protein BC793_101244 [Actinoplanes xinjiangensis]GIF37060.1 hypothetical protein Axi01nite_13710 [Actinoplanes xinjiangensis]
MTLLDASRVILILAAPGAVVAGCRYLPRWCAALAGRRRPPPAPYGPPIEQLAADLRRLLHLHGRLAESAHSAFCAHRLWAVEAAIGTRAVEAATALGVPHPHPDRAATLTRTQLSALLTALARAGLVLPARVGGFTTDGRL